MLRTTTPHRIFRAIQTGRGHRISMVAGGSSMMRRLVLASSALALLASCGGSRLVPIRSNDASIVVPPDGGQPEAPAVDLAMDRVVDVPAEVEPPVDAPADVMDAPKDPPAEEGGVQGCSMTTAPVGFATVRPGTSGGAGPGSRTMTVGTYEALVAATGLPDPTIIEIATLIEAPSGASQIRVQPNKTLRGTARGAGLTGAGLQIFRGGNIIIQNLILTKAAVDDAITVNASTNVWIDHCDVSMAMDGLADVNHGSDWVTMSWNRFHDQSYNSLVGHTAAPENVEDPGKLHVTYHHNWFQGTGFYNPKVRYGQVHVFNNFYDYPDGSTASGVIAQLGAEVRVEGNRFLNIKTPMQTDSDDSKDDPSKQGSIVLGIENKFDGTGNSNITKQSTWDPSPSQYAYVVDPAGTVEQTVSNCAGPLFK